MYATYQFLSSIRDSKLFSKSDEDVVREYQTRLAEHKNVDRHIAEMFCRNFGAWNKIYKLYSNTVPEEDGESLVLEALNKAMTDWDSTSGISFLTYAHRCVNLKLKWMCEYWYPFKGRSVKNDSVEQIIEDKGDCFGSHETSYSDVDTLAGLTNILTEEEYKVVKLIISSPKIYRTDVAAASGLSPYKVDKIYTSLREKLAGAF